MRIVFTENLHSLMLPAAHKFPIGKYDALYRTLASEHPEQMQLGGRAGLHDVMLVHDAAYVQAVSDGTLPVSAIRRLGFPWSEALVMRSLRSVGGTLTALSWAMADGAAGHIAGGTHHAFRDRGEGFCVFNDLAVAVRVAQRDFGVRRVAIVDCDVHQGNGTARIFSGDRDVLTLSLHAARNYPFHKEASSIDRELPDQCDDATYLYALDEALEHVAGHAPELILYQAGVDGLRGDRLGRMALTAEGLARRDARVFALAKRLAVPIVSTLGGGYHRNIEESVEAHANVYRAMARSFA